MAAMSNAPAPPSSRRLPDLARLACGDKAALAAALAEHEARTGSVSVGADTQGGGGDSAWLRAARMAGLR